MSKDNERITYDEFMMMFKIAPSMCYTLYEKAEDEIEKTQKENQQLKENYDRIYNENCKLREKHNITDISLLDENYKLKKQKADVVEYIKYQLSNLDLKKDEDVKAKMLGAMILVMLEDNGMLGETNENKY